MSIPMATATASTLTIRASIPQAAPERYFYCQDANYNVVALRHRSNIVERYEYDPYGSVRIFKGYDPAEGHEDLTVIGDSVAENPILFAGYYFDHETGLYHVRRRMYSLSVQRWLQRDPVGYYDEMNMYGYAIRDPISHTDPRGENAKNCIDYWVDQLRRTLKNSPEEIQDAVSTCLEESNPEPGKPVVDFMKCLLKKLGGKIEDQLLEMACCIMGYGLHPDPCSNSKAKTHVSWCLDCCERGCCKAVIKELLKKNKITQTVADVTKTILTCAYGCQGQCSGCPQQP